MAYPGISQEMLSCLMELNEAERKSVLDLIKTFLQSRKNDLAPQSIEEYNSELDEADKEIESGEFISHEEVMKRYSAK